MINGKQKGKRVELEAAHLLQSLGCPTARRTQQYSGTEGTSDITAEELPHFHIEVKATKEKTLAESKLIKWLEQVNHDCPEGKHWVILHKANDCDFIAIIPPCHYKNVFNKKKVTSWARSYNGTKSYPLFDELYKIYKEARIWKEFLFEDNIPTIKIIGFEVNNQVLFALSIKDWIKCALFWEKSNDKL